MGQSLSPNMPNRGFHLENGFRRSVGLRPQAHSARSGRNPDRLPGPRLLNSDLWWTPVLQLSFPLPPAGYLLRDS